MDISRTIILIAASIAIITLIYMIYCIYYQPASPKNNTVTFDTEDSATCDTGIYKDDDNYSKSTDGLPEYEDSYI